MVLSRIINSIVLLVFFCQVQAQMDSVLVKTFGTGDDDVFNDLIVVDDTLYLVGSSNVCGNEDAVIVRCDTNLNFISEARYGSDVFVEKYHTLEVYEDTLYVAGLSNSGVGYTVTITKLNKELQIIDEVNLDLGDWSICNEMKINNGGWIVGVGKVLGQTGDWDANVFCLNSSLDLQWSFTDGDGMEDEYKDLVFWNDSIIIGTGYWTDEVDGDKDLLLSKINLDGTLQWHSLIGESSDDWAESIIVTNDSSLAMFGTTSSYTSVSEDTYLVKADSNGSFLWSNLHQVQTPDNVLADNGIELLQRSNDEYYLFGILSSFVAPGVYNGAIFHTDLGGNWMATQYVNGLQEDIINDVFQLSDSSIFFCGYTKSYGFGNKEALVGKIAYVGPTDVIVESEEQYFNCYSSISTEDNQGGEIYPNPFNEELYIEVADQSLPCQLKIYNSLGVLVFSDQINSEKEQIQIGKLTGKGLYIFEVEDSEGVQSRWKFIHE